MMERRSLKNRFRAPVLVAVAPLLLGGCASLAPQALFKSDVPAKFSENREAADVWPQPDWWRRFSSGELDSLVEQARTNNLDLSAATARVLQAEANVRIAGAGLLPSVGLAGAAQRQGAADSGTSQSSNAFGINAVVTYEADFWGLARSNLRAAQALARSADYARETVALTVTADVGAVYLDVLGTRERLSIARQNLDTAKRLLSAIERMVAAGLSPQLDLTQQQALIAAQESEIPGLQQHEREARYTLALLLGRAPEEFTVAAESLDGVAIPVVAAGLPSELLRRRPDIAKAEANLAAAHANVDAARAAFFPSIALTASGGIASGAVSAVSTGPAVGELIAEAGSTGLIYGIGITLLQTIFDAGRREAQRDLSKAQELELIANYRGAVFSAFGDVEAALSRAASLAEQERLKANQVDKSKAAFEMLDRQYRQGLAGLLALLQGQQSLFVAQDQLVQIRLARIQAAVTVYKALGGGWSVDVADASAENPAVRKR
jgi:NodT family efflux transporter outer membrane factor (OMF) lipoprotein